MDPYTVIRSRRKTVAIQITPDGQILVRCPLRMPNRQIQQFVAEKQPWIQKHLDKLQTMPSLPLFTPEYLHTLKKEAQQTIPARCAFFANFLEVEYGRITIRCTRSRWGSCSSKGNLNFSCLLMLAPPEVLDYVVVHELCHRLEMNHSAAFWANVARVLPDYPRHRKWLRDNGATLIARLPKS